MKPAHAAPLQRFYVVDVILAASDRFHHLREVIEALDLGAMRLTQPRGSAPLLGCLAQPAIRQGFHPYLLPFRVALASFRPLFFCTLTAAPTTLLPSPLPRPNRFPVRGVPFLLASYASGTSFFGREPRRDRRQS